MKRKITQLVAGLFLASSASASPTPASRPTQRVVLVHGFLENGSAFRHMKKRLERQGIQCYVPKLLHSDGRGGLENLAVHLKKDIEATFGTSEPISIIAFSMGGLVSRYYLQNLGGAKRCENLITISSPHNGTLAAWAYPSLGAQQMRPGSPFLSQLAQSESALKKLAVTSYWTRLDLIILPAKSSLWTRAENIEHPALMHPLMLTSSTVLKGIEAQLLANTSL